MDVWSWTNWICNGSVSVNMTSHISRTAARCFGRPALLRSVQRSCLVMLVSLVTSLVLTKLDYCNSLLVGLLAKLLNRL